MFITCFLIEKQVISTALVVFVPEKNPWPLPLRKLRSMAKLKRHEITTPGGSETGGWQENAAQPRFHQSNEAFWIEKTLAVIIPPKFEIDPGKLPKPNRKGSSSFPTIFQGRAVSFTECRSLEWHHVTFTNERSSH